ncbi:MAG: hypothetical protein Q9162_006456 [Coniocarpon cinnabarinum]
MAMLGQTITVVNKSGKVVSTSKHLVNVFKEAKSAYRERKAEIQATRDGGLEKKRSKNAKTEDSRPPSPRHSPPTPRSPVSRTESVTSVRQESRRDGNRERRREYRPDRRASESRHSTSHRQPMERGYTDSFYTNDTTRRRSHAPPSSPLKFMEEAEKEKEGKELIRRRSLDDIRTESSRRSSQVVRRRTSDIDMDLAYGELPPPLPARPLDEQNELKFKVTSLQRMLEEVNCLQHSAQATIKSLENNPDAMAAVALTMAEISGLVSKVGPGALTALKGSFPAVIALLASPEFLIAAGVGVGVTVIALGGYKIVKRIKAKKANSKNDAESPSGELEEVQSDVNLDRIENWRRGIADVEAQSVGTSVEGELITPGAAKQLREQGNMPSSSRKSKTSKDAKKERAQEKEDKRAREKQEKKEKRDRKERDERERKEQKKEKEREKKGGKEREKKDPQMALMVKGRTEDAQETVRSSQEQ